MPESHVRVPATTHRMLTREQKVGYAVVVGCGALAVVLGLFYIGKHLNGPFALNYSGERPLTSDQVDAARIAEQKAKDTDGDTINDYDELYVYGSSPYITDTDSDGTADNVEIQTGGDPTCAPGANCEDATAIGDDTDVLGDYVDETSANAAAAQAQFEEIRAMLNNLTVDEVRQLLVESGADAAQVSAMTDEQVRELYNSVLAQLDQTGDLQKMLEEAQQSSGE